MKELVGIIKWPDSGSRRTFELRFSAKQDFIRSHIQRIPFSYNSSILKRVIHMLPRVNFYLHCENFLQGFCSLLEAPSGHLLRVGLLIPAVQLSPPWWHDIWIDHQSSSARGTLRESVYTCVATFQIPDSLLQLPGLSTHCSHLPYKLDHAVALLVKCPGGIENIFLM